MHKDPGFGCIGTRERPLFDINLRQRPKLNELWLRREGRHSVLPSLEVLLKEAAIRTNQGTLNNQLKP